MTEKKSRIRTGMPTFTLEMPSPFRPADLEAWEAARGDAAPAQVASQGMAADEILQELPGLARKLRKAPDWRTTRLKSDDGSKAPAKEGVYLFLEGDKPMYVGITTNLRQRLTYHLRLAHNQGTYAYWLARQSANVERPLEGQAERRTRTAMLADPEFMKVFRAMLTRVGAMSVHFVEVKDYVLMGMLELYVAREFRLEQPFRPH